ncbi:MAG: hypothetical protein GY801_29540 [bacterium]|nr:hypothetical protein [bacterium]
MPYPVRFAGDVKPQEGGEQATQALYNLIAEKAWQVYEAETKRSVSQQTRRLREWGGPLTDSPLKTKLLKL